MNAALRNGDCVDVNNGWRRLAPVPAGTGPLVSHVNVDGATVDGTMYEFTR